MERAGGDWAGPGTRDDAILSRMNVPQRRMTVTEFLDWAKAQPSGRYELVDGQVVAMSPERARHNLAKARLWRALTDAVERADLPCTVFTDGMTVVIDQHRSCEPDAAIQCGDTMSLDSVVLDEPLVVVDVVSPSSGLDDTGVLVDYFSVPSIQHYLVVDPEKRTIVHHSRLASDIRTRILDEAGDLSLDPPGLTMPAIDLLREL